MNIHALAAECAVRVAARKEYSLNIGGHRSRDELAMVLRVLAAQPKIIKRRVRHAK